MLIPEYSKPSHKKIRRKSHSRQQTADTEVGASLAGTLEVQEGQCGQGGPVDGETGQVIVREP